LKRRFAPTALTATWLLAFISLNLETPNLSAATDTNGNESISTVNNREQQSHCEKVRAQFTALTCERKATRMPTIVEDLNIHRHYHTWWLWSDVLLKYSQELYNSQPKDLVASSLAVLREAVERCAHTVVCEDQVLGYFGASKKFSSRLHYFFSSNENNGALNKQLASSLGNEMYYSDVGALINRYTDIKVCEQLKLDAKQDQCDLSPNVR
jgi:hypothetical protein